MPIEMTSHTIVEKMNRQLQKGVEGLQVQGIMPSLAVILVGHDPKSEKYVSSIKQQQAEALGIDFTVHRFDEQTSEETIIETIEQLNDEPAVWGIIVQLPLPVHLNTEQILQSVALPKDVDGLRRGSQFLPPTVSAILELFASYGIRLTDKKIVVVGKGRLVGGPLIDELKGLKLDVTVCDETTDDLGSCTIGADILISATGREHLIRSSMVKDDAVVIDVDEEVDYDKVRHRASYITPQRGGVGPLTVAFLLANVVIAAGGKPLVIDEERTDV